VPRVRALRRYKNSGLRRRLQTGPQNFNRVGTRRELLATQVKDLTGGDVQIDFDQSIILSGIPQYYAVDSDEFPISVVLMSPTRIVLTFGLAPGSTLRIPFEDPAVRNDIAGYVRPGDHPII